MAKKVKLLGVGITNEDENKILEYLWSSFRNPQVKYYIVTPNPEILTYAQEHPDYKNVLNGAKFALPDGIGVFLACALMGQPLKERITGVDFIEQICKYSKEKPISMGFLGAGPGVAKRTVECLIRKYPWINVKYVGQEWDKFSEMQTNTQKLNHGNVSLESPYFSRDDPVDILFVAFGFPKQEEWISKNLSNLPVRVAMGVGGAFDFISGDVIRAPFFLRAIGLEWLFRLISQPWRLKRQLSLFRFTFLVLKGRFLEKKLSLN